MKIPYLSLYHQIQYVCHVRWNERNQLKHQTFYKKDRFVKAARYVSFWLYNMIGYHNNQAKKKQIQWMKLINDKVFWLSESFTFSTMNEILFIAYQGSYSAGRYLWNWKNWNYICYFVFNNVKSSML